MAEQDVVVATILSIVGLIKYKAMGAFSVYGIFSVWTPILWTYAFAIFFYLVPIRRAFLVPYCIGFAGLTYIMGLALNSLLSLQ